VSDSIIAGPSGARPEVCVNDYTGPVDHRLNFRKLQRLDARANAVHNVAEVRDFLLRPQQPEFVSNNVNHNPARQIAVADFTDNFLHGRNFPQRAFCLIRYAYAWSAGANDFADHRCAGGAVLFQNTFHFLQSFGRNTEQQAATRLCVCKQKAHRLRSAVPFHNGICCFEILSLSRREHSLAR